MVRFNQVDDDWSGHMRRLWLDGVTTALRPFSGQ